MQSGSDGLISLSNIKFTLEFLSKRSISVIVDCANNRGSHSLKELDESIRNLKMLSSVAKKYGIELDYE